MLLKQIEIFPGYLLQFHRLDIRRTLSWKNNRASESEFKNRTGKLINLVAEVGSIL